MKTYIYMILMFCLLTQNAFSDACVNGKKNAVNLDVHSSSGYMISVTFNPCQSANLFHSLDVSFGGNLPSHQVPKDSKVSVDAYTLGFGYGPTKNLVHQSVGDGMKIICKYTIGYAECTCNGTPCAHD
ncbi:MAG: hypothetical protein H0X26_06275 [Alphaproteobacteria bacterium]|nr:hypothetical protein [Alphaproteobacteria bacterium]